MKTFVLFIIYFFLASSCKQNMSSGEFVNSSIVGGSYAKKGQFSYAGHFVRKNGKSAGENHCSGSIVKEGWVLTAAHCFDGFESAHDSLPFLDSQDGPSFFASQYLQFRLPELGNFDIERVYIHGLYQDEYNQNDLALVKLKESPLLEAISLEFSELYQLEDPLFIAIGFGQDHKQADLSQSGVKKYTEFPVELFYHKFLVSPVGDDFPYHGDSGGPLIIRDEEGDRLVAVTSHHFSSYWNKEGEVAFARVRGQETWFSLVYDLDDSFTFGKLDFFSAYQVSELKMAPSYVFYLKAKYHFEKGQFHDAISFLKLFHSQEGKELQESLDLMYETYVKLKDYEKAQVIWDKLKVLRNPLFGGDTGSII